MRSISSRSAACKIYCRIYSVSTFQLLLGQRILESDEGNDRLTLLSGARSMAR